jgi:hypothetical protein
MDPAMIEGLLNLELQQNISPVQDRKEWKSVVGYQGVNAEH